MINFDLQRFGGGGKGEATVTNSYEPNEYQLHAMQVLSNYIDAAMPQAHNLLNLGNDFLSMSEPALRGMQSQYGDEHIAAQTRYNQAMGQLEQAPEQARQWMADVDEELSQLPAQYNAIGRATSNKLGGVASNLRNALNTSSSSMNDIYSQLSDATNSANSSLLGYIPSNQTAMQSNNTKQQQLINRNNQATNNYVNQLNQITGSNTTATNASNNRLNDYISSNAAANTLANNNITGFMGQNSDIANAINSDFT